MTASVGAVRRRLDTEYIGLRDAFLLALLATGLWTVAGAEFLSLGHWLARRPLVAWWGVPVGTAAAFVGLRRANLKGWITPARPDTITALLIAASAAMLLITGVVAASTLTNTWDCWSYHLPREFYWAQQHSIAHYPAHDLRQIEMPPMAEFLGVQLMLLTKGDLWNNMIQWVALLGTAIAASTTARELGAGSRGQALAALLLIANPAALSETMNGKNDVVVTLWLMIAASLGARAWRQRRCTLGRAVLIGGAFGLALLTKGTGYIAGLPIALAIGFGMLVALRWRAVPIGIAMAVVALSLNVGHWTRNQALIGNPIATPVERGGYPLRNTAFTPPLIASTLIKDLAVHFGTSSPRWNATVTRAIESLHRRAGIAVNDARTNLLEREPFRVEYTATQDGNAGAPAHVLLAGALLVIALARPRLVQASPTWAAFLVPYAAMLAFAAVLRWQPWQLRLQIPVISLLAPVAGCLLPRVRLAVIQVLLTLGVLALAGFNILWSDARTLAGPHSIIGLGREGSLYWNAPELADPIPAAARKAAELAPHSIGICMSGEYEYPLLRELSRTISPRPIFVNLNPNFGPKPGHDALVPDIVVAAGTDSAVPILQYSTGRWFVPVAIYPPLSVYVSAERASKSFKSGVAPFFGWDRSEGLEPPEGPYPQWDMPVVRWSKNLKTTLSFKSDGRPAVLLMECRRNDRNDQQMWVHLNGKEVYAFNFGPAWTFFPHRVQLQPIRGRNTLEITYANINEPGVPRAVQYSRLQILPADEAPSPAPPGGATPP